MSTRRRTGGYFAAEAGGCPPVVAEIKRRVGFSDTDVMGIAWYGKYPLFFEEGSAALGRICGLTYRDFFEAGLRAPVVECHVDYHAPLELDAVFTIRARMVWCESARLNTEYELIKEDGTLAASGYTVQMLVSVAGGVSGAGLAGHTPAMAASALGDICLVPPPLIVRVRERWRRGEFK